MKTKLKKIYGGWNRKKNNSNLIKYFKKIISWRKVWKKIYKSKELAKKTNKKW
jgi:hypothetical protein